jgi:CRISPR-associated protein Cas1
MIKRTLYFTQAAYLSVAHKQLVVEYPETKGDKKTIPLEDIGMVILEHPRITITHHSLQSLMDWGAVAVTCNAQTLPSGLLLPIAGHSEQTERYHKQINASIPLKKNLWQQTVIAKILNQKSLLQQRDKEAKVLEKWAFRVSAGDAENREGQAAAYYWQNIIEDALFTRGQDGIPPNNFLNYGYAILRAIVARALVGSGLLLSLGIWHKNKYNPYCLADDIMEPYRPFVDKLVLDYMDYEEDWEELSTKGKMHLLQIASVDVKMGKKQSPLWVAVSRTTNSLAECFMGKSRKILYPTL